MPLFQRESPTTSKRGIAASKSELLARLAEFSAVDDSAYLSEEGFVEARRAAVRQQRRLVRRSDEDSGFLCAPSTRKSSQRHRVWQPDDVRAPWIEYDKVCAEGARTLERPRSAVRGGAGVTERFAGLGGARAARPGSAAALRRAPPPRDRVRAAPLGGARARASTALLTDYKASAAAPATKPRRFARVDPNVPATRRSLLTRQLSASTLPLPAAATPSYDAPDAVYDWDVDVDVAAALRPGKRVATLGEAECRTWSVEDDRATPMPAYAAVSCDLLAKLSPLLMRGEHGPLVAKLAAALRECVYVDPGTDEDARELFADETWFDRCLRVERELERLKEDMKLARAGVTLKNQLEKRLPGREKRATFPKAPISADARAGAGTPSSSAGAARAGLLAAARAGPPRVRESLLERFRQDKHASMHDRFFDEEEPEELDDDAPVDPMQRLLALNRMKRLHDGRNTRVTRVLRDGGPEVIDKATSTPADWEVRTQKTMIAEAKDKDDHSKNVNLKRALGRTDKVAEMPVEKAVSLIPLIFEELVNYWGPRAYHNLNLDVDWTAPRKRAHKVQVELATNATVRKYGLKTLAVSHLRALCRSVEKLASKNKRLRLFGELFGIVPEEPRPRRRSGGSGWTTSSTTRRPGCMEFFDFNAAVVEGTAAPPAEALVMRLYTEWGTVAEEYADKEREGKLIRIAGRAGHERDATHRLRSRPRSARSG
ncbi:oxidoreductase [Aureococcus anophagefferens]|nr:oxidoreductase [Aureococcus anophagefferens]